MELKQQVANAILIALQEGLIDKLAERVSEVLTQTGALPADVLEERARHRG